MEKLGELFEETDTTIGKKEELEQKEETLDGQIRHVIEERDSYIMERLNALQGDAADKVKSSLDEQANKKLDVLTETKAEVQETEEFLSSRLKLLVAQIGERNHALLKVKDLGREAEIDVAESVAGIQKEISEMNEAKNKILDVLRTRAKTTGKPIVI